MDDVYKMYAMSDGEGDAEPPEIDHDQDMVDEDEEVETSSVLTSSDDDEGVPEETSVVISEPPRPTPAKKAPAKKAAKKGKNCKEGMDEFFLARKQTIASWKASSQGKLAVFVAGCGS